MFYGIGAAVIGIITRSAFKLTKLTRGKDKLLWGIFAVLAISTVGQELTRPVTENVGGRTVVLRRRPTVSESARLLDVASRLEQSVRGTPREDVIVTIELQKQPRYLSVPASADPTSEQS